MNSANFDLPQSPNTAQAQNTPWRARLGSALLVASCWIGLGLLLSAARLASASFISQGDFPLHYQLVRAFNLALNEGEWLPRWAGLLDGGNGDAFFTFYPPLCYWISYFFTRVFGLSIIGSLKATTLLSLVLAQASAYALARNFFTRNVSLLAAAAYVTLPAYPLILMNRGFLANGLALALLPLAILGACWLLTGERIWAGALLFAFGFSLVLLTHVISTLLCGITISLLALVYWPQCGWRGWARLLAAGLLALAMTAFFWLPQQIEMRWVQVALQKSQQDYRNYFLFAQIPTDQAFKRVWGGFNYVVSWLTLLQTFIAAAIIAVLWRHPLRNATRTLLWFCLAVCGFAFIISLPWSDPLWRVFSPLQYLQFHWRMQPLTALAGGLLLALCVTHWPEFARKQRLALIGGVSWVLVLALFLTFNFVKLNAGKLAALNIEQELQPLTATPAASFEEVMNSEDVTKVLHYTANQQYFRPHGADALLHATAAQPGGLALLTNAAQPAPAVNGKVLAQTIRNAHREFELELAAPTRARLASYNYPHWVARLNGQPLPIQTEANSGLMLFDVPAGRHHLSVSYEPNSRPEQLARIFSLLGWLGWLGLLGWFVRDHLLRSASRR